MSSLGYLNGMTRGGAPGGPPAGWGQRGRGRGRGGVNARPPPPPTPTPRPAPAVAPPAPPAPYPGAGAYAGGGDVYANYPRAAAPPPPPSAAVAEAPRPVQPQPLQELQRLKQRLDDMSGETGFGLVYGSKDDPDKPPRVKLYNAIGGVAVAQATRDKWLKVRLPKVAAGAGAWYRVTEIDNATGDVATFYVPDKTEDGSNAFASFSLWPTK